MRIKGVTPEEVVPSRRKGRKGRSVVLEQGTLELERERCDAVECRVRETVV